VSREQFSDDCPGCRPAFIDLSGNATPSEQRKVQTMLDTVWASTTIHERRAWHAVTCLNSRDQLDLTLCHGLTQKFQRAMDTL
jgi:hypothetical protein